MKAIKFIAMFAASLAIGASFADVDSYLYYMLDGDLKWSALAGSTLSGNKVSVDEDTYTKVSTDGGSSYLTLYSAQGGSTGSDELGSGQTGIAGFSSATLFPSFLFEVYDAYDQKIGWTTLAYADAANYIYSDPSNKSGVSVYKVTQLIPEPTSGLLFLLGAAGLALRRRKMALA